MTEQDDHVAANAGDEPRCDCGYRSQGDTLEERIRDAQRHAREVHGIDVTADQVLTNGEGRTP